MTYLLIKFYIPGSNYVSYCCQIGRQMKVFARPRYSCFTFHEVYLNKSSIFFKIAYYTTFQGPVLGGASVDCTTQFVRMPCCCN
jgi:hypothetical protein